jgi:hypothetical protein
MPSRFAEAREAKEIEVREVEVGMDVESLPEEAASEVFVESSLRP